MSSMKVSAMRVQPRRRRGTACLSRLEEFDCLPIEKRNRQSHSLAFCPPPRPAPPPPTPRKGIRAAVTPKARTFRACVFIAFALLPLRRRSRASAPPSSSDFMFCFSVLPLPVRKRSDVVFLPCTQPEAKSEKQILMSAPSGFLQNS